MTKANHRSGSHPPSRAEDAEELRFLRSIPWIIDAQQQDPDYLIKSLRSEKSRFGELPRRPTFSLLTVLRDTPPRHLREFIWSCRCQSYQNWQLCLVDDGSTSREHLEIARRWLIRDERICLRVVEKPQGPAVARNLALHDATGDFLIVADGDGLLHPMALGVLARHLNEDPRVNLVFSNEAEINVHSTEVANFLLKPPFDLFTLLRIPYIGRLYAVQRSLLESVTQGQAAFRSEYDGIEEQDLLLRLALSGSLEPRHASFFLYYRRAHSKSLARLQARELGEKRRLLLHEHAPRAYPGMICTVKVSKDHDPLAPSTIRITDVTDRPSPRLLIVVAFKDQVETTIQCLESLEKQEHRLDVVVALVNNRSAEPHTLPDLRSWIEKPRRLRYEVMDHDGAFNFARINNGAVARYGHDRDLILFLNNDVELTTPSCLQSMAMHLLAHPSTGFVGIKLYYPGGTEIQHGGIRLGALICGSGFNEILHSRTTGEFVDADRISLGVTFACAMTRRETFEKLGRLEEFFFPNGYGDVFACLRALEAGYRNYYLGSLSGIHHEGKSRGLSNEDVEFSALYERQGGTIGAWRLRHLQRSHRHAWPVVVLPWNYPARAAQTDMAAPTAEAAGPAIVHLPHPAYPLPLRHKIADQLVEGFKHGLGPGYGILRSGFMRTVAGYRLLTKPGAVCTLIKQRIEPIPVVGPASRRIVRKLRTYRARTIKLAILSKHLLRHPVAARSLAAAYRQEGRPGLRQEVGFQVPVLRPPTLSAEEWFRRTRPSPGQLAEQRAHEWPADAPRITIIMPVYNAAEPWLRQAIGSVLAQTYPDWELVCVNDGSPARHIRLVLDELAASDSRLIVIHCKQNRGVSAATNIGLKAAQGDYTAFMDHDDFLEPHALFRFAAAILQDRPDMLYSDEAITGEDIDDLPLVTTRPVFSYDHYLGHPYFVHLIAARTELVKQVGGLDETMNISQDVDFNLRLIEVCRTICHVPDVLYRWRTHVRSLGHEKMDQCRLMTRRALERHFARTGQVVQFEDEDFFNFRDLLFQHRTRARVAIIVLPRTDEESLGACTRSLEQTVDPSLADLIVACQTEDSNWSPVLADLKLRYRIVNCTGIDGLAAIVNHCEAAVRGPYTHYLILSPEVEAIDSGWLEHMLGYGQRDDVGVVGALLLDRSEMIQHSGLVIGLNGLVDSLYKDRPYRGWLSGREPGQDGILLASRDVSAVTAACLLTRADLFRRLDGFDERLVYSLSDVDYCLRTSAHGYKIIQDAYAVLFCSGTTKPGPERNGRHAEDVRLFRERYGQLIRKGDCWCSPYASRFTTAFPFDILVRPGANHPPRTMRVVLPGSSNRRNTRHSAHLADHSDRRAPHLGLPNTIHRKVIE